MNDDTLDMASLARFAILPGASALMRAFSEIPPGPMRDAVIHLARTTAATYTGAPAQHRMPDPLAGFAPIPAAQITSRTGRAPKTDSPEVSAVEMRLKGATVKEIVAATGMTKQRVYAACHAAKKAGVALPPLRKSGPIEVGSNRWAVTVDDLSFQGVAMTAKAAAARGITSQQYLDRRLLALKMAQGGASYDRILEATGEKDAKVVSAWLSSARGAGHAVPYVTFLQHPADEPEAAPAPEPEPVADAVVAPIGRVFSSDVTHPSSRTAILNAAVRRGITVGAYQDLRESIVRHRLDGKTPSEIQTVTGETKQFVKDTIDMATARGVTFPPLHASDFPETSVEPAVSLKETG